MNDHPNISDSDLQCVLHKNKTKIRRKNLKNEKKIGSKKRINMKKKKMKKKKIK